MRAKGGWFLREVCLLRNKKGKSKDLSISEIKQDSFQYLSFDSQGVSFFQTPGHFIDSPSTTLKIAKKYFNLLAARKISFHNHSTTSFVVMIFQTGGKGPLSF